MKNELTPQILALYLGQKCDIKWLYTDTLDGAFKSGDVWHDSPIHGAHIIRLERGEAEVTPRLRPLSSITEAEARELYEIEYGVDWESNEGRLCPRHWFENGTQIVIGSPAVFLKLLSWGFDLFQGIEAGWAKEVK